MGTEFFEGGRREPFEVVIAGGGVAALEGLLALRELGGDAVSVLLLSPQREFVYRPLSVVEPFGLGEPRTMDLAGFCREQNAAYRAEGVAEIWDGPQRVLTGSGEEVPFDALLVATGARQREALPGSLTFRGRPDVAAFAELLGQLEEGAVRRVAFVVPPEVRWALPLYELALLTAGRLAHRGVRDVELVFVTHEPQPLGVFGHDAGDVVAGLLADSGIELLAERDAESVGERGLVLEGGEEVAADRVVSLPRLEAPEIPGLQGGRGGFIGTDAEMRVDGASRVWAVGDVTWFPIKQGGLAAQMADVAAASIAATVGLDVTVPPFRPVMRAALLTDSGPEYLRAAVEPGPGEGEAGRSPLWWPPSKIAGRLLAPYLARRWEGEKTFPLEDIEAVYGDDPERAERDHSDALELALACADADARWRDYRQALRWLDIAEQLSVVLPADYTEKRREWRQAAGLDAAEGDQR